MNYRVKCILIGFDVLANACSGGDEYQTISCRIGLAIKEKKGWLGTFPWPAWWVEHCLEAIEERIV
jgi:hypothetical protein